MRHHFPPTRMSIVFLFLRKITNVSDVCVLAAQPCLTLCDPIDCSPPGSSVLGILQARILEWVALSFSRGSSWPRDGTLVSCIAASFFTTWAIREAQMLGRMWRNWNPCELLVRRWNDSASGGNSLVIPQKTKHRITKWPSNPIPR